MLQIRAAQMDQLRLAQRQRLDRDAAAFLLRHFPQASADQRDQFDVAVAQEVDRALAKTLPERCGCVNQLTAVRAAGLRPFNIFQAVDAKIWLAAGDQCLQKMRGRRSPLAGHLLCRQRGAAPHRAAIGRCAGPEPG